MTQMFAARQSTPRAAQLSASSSAQGDNDKQEDNDFEGQTRRGQGGMSLMTKTTCAARPRVMRTWNSSNTVQCRNRMTSDQRCRQARRALAPEVCPYGRTATTDATMKHKCNFELWQEYSLYLLY